MKPVSPSYKSPKRLLQELGITEPEDLDVEAIAQYCDATIVYERLTGSEARIIGNGNKAIITINEGSPRQRQRFSAGHELGHWMRDRGKITLNCTDRIYQTVWADDSPEQRANRYAVELLMPDAMFQPRTAGLPLTFATVRSLCGMFNTSITATAIRLVDLSSYNGMIVCFQAGQRKWFRRGSDIPAILWPHDRCSHFTKAAHLPNTIGAEDMGSIGADSWVKHPDSWQYTVQEDSIVIAPDMTLSLIWWQDEKQLLDRDPDKTGN
jgi:hypothetical protein